MRVFLNLRDGLDRIGVPYRVNDYRFAANNPSHLACVIGKPHLLDHIDWKSPILFGAAIHSHPSDDPRLMERLPVKKVLVPGPWMKEMCAPYWKSVEYWPVGIDTDRWHAVDSQQKKFDVLLYDKIRWDHDSFETSLLEPIRNLLRKKGRSFAEIRYGFYEEDDFLNLLGQSKTMIFLCEHETQGIAYQQALSCNVPILAWDRKGVWRDPAYFPERAIFQPVTSVPYWDERCGLKFEKETDLPMAWEEFWTKHRALEFKPRDYVMEELTLQLCASKYTKIAMDLM